MSDFNISTRITNNFSKAVQVVNIKCILAGDATYSYYGPAGKADIEPVEIASGETVELLFTFKEDDNYAIGHNFYNPSNLPVGEYGYNIYLYGKITDAPTTDLYHVKENLILSNMGSNVVFSTDQVLNITITNAKYQGENPVIPDNPVNPGGGDYPSEDPDGNVPGFDSYSSSKQIELMHVAILPHCSDHYLYTEHYFNFDHIDNNEKKYIFIETGSNGTYHIKGPYADLGVMTYGSSNVAPYSGDLAYDSPPTIPTYVSSKSELIRYLHTLQEVGDTAGRELLFDANYGRVRPLGHVNYDSGKVNRINGVIGNKWNGIYNSSLICRIVGSLTLFDSTRTSEDMPGDKPTSYPSGHSAQFYALSLGLAHIYGVHNDMANARKYMHIAYKIGILRAIGRWHWNSDILYGKLLGTMLLPILNASDTFRGWFSNAYNLLIGGSPSISDASTFSIDTNANTFSDFKALVNKIVEISGVGPAWVDGTSESDKVWKYLWWMYETGRATVDSNMTDSYGFNFFNSTDYVEGNINSASNWFPEIFPSSGHSITPNKDGSSVTVKLHGSNTTYHRGISRNDYSEGADVSDTDITTIKSIIDGSKNLTNHEILCSWLMACCLSEIYCSTSGGSTSNVNNQTKLFAAAYEIGGGRELNIYDEYALNHDPMYLRLAAGIVYAYCRGKVNDNIRSSAFTISDVNSDNTVDQNDVNSIIGNDAVRQMYRSGDGYISGDIVYYGVDSYYIFPNAPGPYVSGRGSLAKPFENKSIGSSGLNTLSLSGTLFITNYTVITHHDEPGGSDEISYNYDANNPTLSKDIILLGNSSSLEGEKLYSIGILSDLHLRKNHDTDSSTGQLKDWYDEDDLDFILKTFKADSNIKFICSCGDIIDSAATHHIDDDESPQADTNQFYNVMKNYKNDLRFFSCLGNHDSAGLYNSRTGDTINSGLRNDNSADGYNSGAKARIDNMWFNKILFNLGTTSRSSEEVHYFSYSGGLTNSYSKLNYYIEKGDEIYIFMSIDYGNEPYALTTSWHDLMIRGRKLLTSSEIASLSSYATDYNSSVEANYSYLYYHPLVLLWLKDIIENNTNKKIFVFSHHFLPHRVGNDLSSSSTYASIKPASEPYTYANGDGYGSNALSGVEFHFINRLVNDHTNVIWFSGHSHISWDNGGESYHITNHDYPVKLSGDYKTIYTKNGSAKAGNTGWWVALPSMTKPVKSSGSVYDDADFTIMDVYSNGVRVKGYNVTRTVTHTGNASDLDTKLHAMYLAIPECTQNEATWGTSASDLQKLGSTDTSKGYIKIHITNESGYDVVWNGRAAIFYGDGSEHDKHQIYCGWRVDNYQDDTLWHSWHYYYTDPTNYIFESGDSVDIIVPIKTSDYDLTGKYIWNKVRYRKPSADSPDSARDSSLGLDDNDYFRLYYTKSKTSDDLPHSASLDIVDERIISNTAIINGNTYNVKITADRMAGWVTAGVYAKSGFNHEADKACIVYQSTPTSGDPYDVYVPMRISDWETINTGGENEQEGGDRVLTEHPDLGPVYLDIKIHNTTNHDIYVTERFKFFPIRGDEWGYFYILGPNYKNYANIKIAAGETKTFSHDTLVYEEGSAVKNNGGRTDLHKHASYMNDVVLRNDNLDDEVGVYTWFNSGGAPQFGKLYPVQKSNGDADITPLTWQAGTASNITLYVINVTDDNDTYWTTPR